MKVEETYHTCDVCQRKIKDYDPNGSIIIDWMGGNQVWPIGEKCFDVCEGCAGILALAKSLGIVTYDEEPLYRQAGFEWDKKRHCWHHLGTGLIRFVEKGDQ